MKDGQDGFIEFFADFPRRDPVRDITIVRGFEDETASGHTQIDGPTEPTDLDQTEQNKALVRAFLDDMVRSGTYSDLERYISSDTFTQHNPRIADGLDGLRSFLDGLAPEGQSMTYEEIGPPDTWVNSGTF